MNSSDISAVEYVEIKKEHLDAIMEIEVEAYPDAWSLGMFQQELKLGKSYFYVILTSDEVIGYGGFWLVLDEAHITSITVKDTYRGRGLGRQLLEYVLEKARKVNANIATLEVRESNKTARSLYGKMDFLEVGIRKNYYPSSGENAVVMLKELK